jgi:hypothetical protein
MKKAHARDRERNEKDQTDKPTDEKLDVRALSFCGLDFQLVELRYGVLEVNLGGVDRRLATPRAKEHKQELRLAFGISPSVFALPLPPKYAK